MAIRLNLVKLGDFEFAATDVQSSAMQVIGAQILGAVEKAAVFEIVQKVEITGWGPSRAP
jgi:hypothetical protein